jgi:hypothetical protein
VGFCQQETLKMSRGLGKVQAGLLAIIERQEKPTHTYRLARMFYQPEVVGKCLLIRAQVKATYRALCSLEKRGKIESHGHRGNGYGGADGFIWWNRLGAERLTADERLARDRAAAIALGERMRVAMGE